MSTVAAGVAEGAGRGGWALAGPVCIATSWLRLSRRSKPIVTSDWLVVPYIWPVSSECGLRARAYVLQIPWILRSPGTGLLTVSITEIGRSSRHGTNPRRELGRHE